MQIARVFFDIHMAKNFQGLLEICHEAKIKPEAQKESYIVFINRSQTKFKVLVGNSYLVYCDNKHRKIPLDAIRYLPHAFGGNEFNFSAAVEKSLESKLGAALFQDTK